MTPNSSLVTYRAHEIEIESEIELDKGYVLDPLANTLPAVTAIPFYDAFTSSAPPYFLDEIRLGRRKTLGTAHTFDPAATSIPTFDD